MADDLRLSYLHLMNKAAQSEDRQSYFHYLKLAERRLRSSQRDPDIWQPTAETIKASSDGAVFKGAVFKGRSTLNLRPCFRC